MIHCEACGAQHRTQEAADACKARAERRAARAKAREADRIVRARNHATQPPSAYIARRHREGAAWVNIIAGLNREYFPPKGKKKWDLVSVVELDSKRYRWPDPDKGEYWVVPESWKPLMSIGALQEWYNLQVEGGNINTVTKGKLPEFEAPSGPPPWWDREALTAWFNRDKGGEKE